MVPRIETLLPKKLVGKKMRMSFAKDRTVELWRSFMSRRSEFANFAGSDLFSLQMYGENFDFRNCDPGTEFEKWAAVEVRDFDSIPNEMETLELGGGLYAVFKHKGGPATAGQTFGYIFETWIPSSGYAIDARPHFEVLGEKYGDGGKDSEEEIWIPIRSNE